MNVDWNPPDDVVRAARVHAALGDPHRLAMARELALGDRSPAWFASQWGLASNLVAHHVGVLAEAGLLQRTPSRADRRRVFLRLTDAGRAVVAAPAVAADEVVFVCTHNSARSQFAEALWRRSSAVPARSGGTLPAERVHPMAVRAARRRGTDLSRAVPTLAPAQPPPGALLVTVCDSADRETERPHLHWSVPDPVEAGTDRAFDDAWETIATRVLTLSAAMPHDTVTGAP